MHNTSLFDFPRSYFQHLLKSDPDYKHPLYKDYPYGYYTVIHKPCFGNIPRNCDISTEACHALIRGTRFVLSVISYFAYIQLITHPPPSICLGYQGWGRCGNL